MNRLLLPLTIACAFALPAYAQDKHGDHAPKFGGVVVETKAGDLELVAKPDLSQIMMVVVQGLGLECVGHVGGKGELVVELGGLGVFHSADKVALDKRERLGAARGRVGPVYYAHFLHLHKN